MQMRLKWRVEPAIVVASMATAYLADDISGTAVLAEVDRALLFRANLQVKI